MAAPRNMARLWVAPISFSGTAIIPCLRKWRSLEPWLRICGEGTAVAARWRSDFVLWSEVFAIVNLAFLGLDIFLAHSENSFGRRAEWLPLYFSLVAPPVHLLAVVARQRQQRPELWRILGYAVGATAVVVGLAGVIFHLDSQFFYEKTLVSLTYAAPFVAPLAYTGLGLLLIMNRMVDAASPEWAQWLLLLTLGGFFGNFILSLTDHAEDGFFRAAEWIPVVSSAFAVAFLVLPLLIRVTCRYLWVCAGVLLVQASVGLLGFVYHLTGRPGRPVKESVR
jgi:hypothetical protein